MVLILMATYTWLPLFKGVCAKTTKTAQEQKSHPSETSCSRLLEEPLHEPQVHLREIGVAARHLSAVLEAPKGVMIPCLF